MKKFLFTLVLASFLVAPLSASAARYESLSIGKIVSEGERIGTEYTLIEDASGDKLFVKGTTVPTATTSGYAKSALFIDTDVAAGSPALYENQGSTTSCDFQLVGAVSATDAIYGGDGNLQARIARATFDFAVDGGAHNTDYDLGVDLPDNAVITRAWYEVITTFQSGTDAALIGIGLPTDDAQGIVAFASISSGTPFDAGYHEAIQTGTAANFSIKTTAARAVTFNVASTADGDLTAGALVLFLEYVISD
jgi:hypothetical protein